MKRGRKGALTLGAMVLLAGLFEGVMLDIRLGEEGHGGSVAWMAVNFNKKGLTNNAHYAYTKM